MLALDFVKANRETVERAIRDKGVELDLDALLALDAKCAARRPRSSGCAPSATRSAPGSRTRRPRRRPSSARKAKEAGARAGELEGGSASKEAALKALMLQLPGIP